MTVELWIPSRISFDPSQTPRGPEGLSGVSPVGTLQPCVNSNRPTLTPATDPVTGPSSPYLTQKGEERVRSIDFVCVGGGPGPDHLRAEDRGPVGTETKPIRTGVSNRPQVLYSCTRLRETRVGTEEGRKGLVGVTQG